MRRTLTRPARGGQTVRRQNLRRAPRRRAPDARRMGRSRIARWHPPCWWQRMTHHAAIWLDHHEARVLRLAREGTGYYVEVLRAADLHEQTHTKVGDGHRHPADPRYLQQIADVVARCEAVLLCGPADAKDELARHISEKHPELVARLTIEPADRMTDGELAVRARHLFRRTDAMKGIGVARHG
jgi:hypothetical protein